MNYLKLIKDTQDKLNALEADYIKSLEKEVMALPEYKELMKEIEACKYYSFDQCGDVGQVFGYDLEKEFTKKYNKYYFDSLCNILQDQYCAYWEDIDKQFIIIDSDAIVINEDNDIFQNSKCIIKHQDYETKEERNALIESHMESSGVYSGVYKTDHYGNVKQINTQGE